MRLTTTPIRFLSAAVLALTCALAWQGAAVMAQGTIGTGPAELPPASYTGRQYVDSKGCVFVRAGMDGAVAWVPRVSRSREQLCGATPTQLANSAAAPRAGQRSAAAPVVLPPARDLNPANTEAAAVAVAAPSVAPRPAAAPRPQAARAATTVPVSAPRAIPVSAPRAAPVSAPRAAPVRAAAPRVVVPASRRVMATAPAVARVQTPTPTQTASPVTAGASPCGNLSPVGQAYMRPGAGLRCGPQAASPVGSGAVGARRAIATSDVAVSPAAPGGMVPGLTGQTRVAPRHVAAMQAQSADLTMPPPGYRPVWEDDRLNPRRAHQTLDGRAQMYLRWTRDVPQRLVDIRTGADVTAFNPDLVYPFVSRDAQQAAQSAAARGQRVVVVSSQSRQPISVAGSAGASPRVSSSAPPRAQAIAPTYVQVGSFANAANAQAAAARLGGLGLPVAQGRLTRGGQVLAVVLAGPFRSEAAVNSALARARSAGFGDAFVRR